MELICVLCRLGKVVLDPLTLECGCILLSGICPSCRVNMKMTTVRNECDLSHSEL